MEHKMPTKLDAAAAFLASLEESKITSLQDSAKKPPIEILPPGMASLYGPNLGQSGVKKPAPALLQQKISNQLLLEGPNEAPQNASTSLEATVGQPPPSAESCLPQNSTMEASGTSDSLADSSISAPTSQLPVSTDTKSEADASLPPLMDSSDLKPSQLDVNTMENQEVTSSTKGSVPEPTIIEESLTEATGIEGVPDPTVTEGNVLEPTETEGSVPPASTDSPAVANEGQQESNERGKEVQARPEISMIDFT